MPFENVLSIHSRFLRLLIICLLSTSLTIYIYIVENKLYWVDAFQDKIEVMDLINYNRTIILQEVKAHYFGIALLGDYLYYTCWIKK